VDTLLRRDLEHHPGEAGDYVVMLLPLINLVPNLTSSSMYPTTIRGIGRARSGNDNEI